MDQLDEFETTAPVSTPVLAPTPAPEKTPKSKIIFALLAGLVFLSLVGYATYGFLTINDLNEQATSQQKLVAQLKADNKKLVTDNRELANKAKKTTATATTSTSSTDDSFVALTPENGAKSTSGATTFTWAAHKKANKYVIEIKKAGEATYPAKYAADQTFIVEDTGAIAPPLTLTKTLDKGSYVWRVTALNSMLGNDMVLQSTADRTYQVQ